MLLCVRIERCVSSSPTRSLLSSIASDIRFPFPYVSLPLTFCSDVCCCVLSTFGHVWERGPERALWVQSWAGRIPSALWPHRSFWSPTTAVAHTNIGFPPGFLQFCPQHFTQAHSGHVECVQHCMVYVPAGWTANTPATYATHWPWTQVRVAKHEGDGWGSLPTQHNRWWFCLTS